MAGIRYSDPLVTSLGGYLRVFVQIARITTLKPFWGNFKLCVVSALQIEHFLLIILFLNKFKRNNRRIEIAEIFVNKNRFCYN